MCEDLEDPENGGVNISSMVLPGTVAAYSCDEGFVLNGTATRECGADGKWTNIAPTCERKYTNPN